MVHVALTRERGGNSPDIDTNQPVSRQLEVEFSKYDGFGHYWNGPYLWGVGGYPIYPLPESGTVPPMEMRPDAVAERAADRSEDVHLRRCKEVIGYHIAGTADDISHEIGRASCRERVCEYV